MLTPEQITKSGAVIEKICQEFEAELSEKLTKLLEFLLLPTLGSFDEERAVKEARDIISKTQSSLRKKTNAAIIAEFKKFTKDSTKSDVAAFAEAHTKE